MFKQFLDSYLVCALWSSCDDNDRPLDENYDISDLDMHTLEKCKTDCKNFIEENNDLLTKFMEDTNEDISECGHLFWLNRNGHGCGFWEYHYTSEVADKLSESCKVYNSVDFYIGDDGKIYC